MLRAPLPPGFPSTAALRRVIGACLMAAPMLTTPARAEPAYALFATFVRAAPAAGAATTDELQAGQHVDRGACADGWCRLTGTGGGYVMAGVLAPLLPSGQTPTLVPAPGDCIPAQHFTMAGPIALRVCPAVVQPSPQK